MILQLVWMVKEPWLLGMMMRTWSLALKNLQMAFLHLTTLDPSFQGISTSDIEQESSLLSMSLLPLDLLCDIVKSIYLIFCRPQMLLCNLHLQNEIIEFKTGVLVYSKSYLVLFDIVLIEIPGSDMRIT